MESFVGHFTEYLGEASPTNQLYFVFDHDVSSLTIENLNFCPTKSTLFTDITWQAGITLPFPYALLPDLIKGVAWCEPQQCIAKYKMSRRA